MSRIRTVMAMAVLAVTLALPGTAQAVVGGTPPSRDYPFMAAMLWDGFQYCGASLVAPEYVLTAAHCWDDKDPDTTDPKPGEIEFVIGGVNLTLEERGLEDGERVRPTSVEVHPNWNATKPPKGVEESSYDVAVVRLSEAASAPPIALADPVTQRRLWVAEPGLTADRKPARVIGYGLPSFDPPGALFETDVPMVADEDCKESYDLTGGGFESTTMVCAGEPFGVKDSCFGDSGGPLVVSPTGDLSAGPLVQVGVVSWGFLCGVPTQPGVYARVGDDPLHDWIKRRIGGNAMPPAPGTIAGRVTDSKTRAALSSANVDCGAGGSATTGADGSYSIAAVPAGSQTCTASKSGYQSKTQTVDVPSGGTATANFALPAQKSGAGGGGKGKQPR